MRCKACDNSLNDYEATRKSTITGEYFDLCNACFSFIEKDVSFIDRADLNPNIVDHSDDKEES